MASIFANVTFFDKESVLLFLELYLFCANGIDFNFLWLI